MLSSYKLHIVYMNDLIDFITTALNSCITVLFNFCITDSVWEGLKHSTSSKKMLDLGSKRIQKVIQDRVGDHQSTVIDIDWSRLLVSGH